MDFRIDQTIAVPVTRIQELLGDEAFVTATSELAPLADCRLLAAETSGTRRRLRIARRFAAALPSVVTAVVDPDRLTWVEEVDADLAAGRADHRIVPDHYTDLLRVVHHRAAPRGDGGGRHPATRPGHGPRPGPARCRAGGAGHRVGARGVRRPRGRPVGHVGAPVSAAAR